MTLYGRTSQSQCFIFACEHQKSQSSSQEPWWVPMPMPDRPGCIPSLNRGLKCTPEVGEGCHTRASSRRWSFPLFLSFSAYPCCPGTQARSFGWVAAFLFYHLPFRLAVKARIRALLGCQVFCKEPISTLVAMAAVPGVIAQIPGGTQTSVAANLAFPFLLSNRQGH